MPEVVGVTLKVGLYTDRAFSFRHTLLMSSESLFLERPSVEWGQEIRFVIFTNAPSMESRHACNTGQWLDKIVCFLATLRGSRGLLLDLCPGTTSCQLFEGDLCAVLQIKPWLIRYKASQYLSTLSLCYLSGPMPTF